jgi:hypothetical protein
MIKYKYTFYNDVRCDQDFFIHEMNEEGQYLVEWENQLMGYLYIDGPGTSSVTRTWKGNTPELNLIAGILGDWIEHSDQLDKAGLSA